MSIAAEIKFFRKKLKLTQKEFADLFNSFPPKGLQTHPRDISKYERGMTIPPTKKYMKFKQVFVKHS